LGDGFIFAATGGGAIEALSRVKHHLRAFGRAEDDFGCELLTQFARNPHEAASHLKMWRDAGGTDGCVPSTDKGFGSNIEAHIDYIAEVKRFMDAG
jgi:hypothetical protein